MNTKNQGDVAQVEAFLDEKARKLAAKVESLFLETGSGVASGALIHAHGFTQKDIQRATDMRLIESRKGKGGGIFPFGCIPESKGDDTPSCTSRAFDMILSISRGETVDREAARQLWEEREALNASRRKE